MRICVRCKDLTLTATLRDTATVRALLASLPCRTRANTWGEEVYFSVPVVAECERDAQDIVEPGKVGFWVEGRALAIPFGRTPISTGDECRLAAKVNILGRLDGDPKSLAAIRAGDEITVEVETQARSDLNEK